MGESMEITAKEWHLTREEQDALALASHQNAARAYAEGFYDDLVVEFQGVKRDNNLRTDTSLEQLAKLKPVFDRGPGGTLTAGNSTPLTDGASAVLLVLGGLGEEPRLADCGLSDVRARSGRRLRRQGRAC